MDRMSQDDIDALLGGETPKPAEEPSGSGARAYDLLSQKRVIRGRMPGIEILGEKFARAAKASLTNTLGRTVDMLPSGMEVTRFGDFLNSLEVPTNLNVFSMEPLEGHALFVIEANLVFSLVNCFFGGSPGFHAKVEGREFTQIEQKVIGKTVRLLLKDYEAAWRSVHQVSCKYVRSEINPRSAAIVSQSETMIAQEFKVEIDDKTGRMFVCLSYASLEPISEALFEGFSDMQPGSSGRWRSYLEGKVSECEVDVSAELGVVTLTMGELMGLQPGDVLKLNKKPDSPLEVRVEGLPKFLGTPGAFNGNQAVKITGFLKRSEP
ncbi:MAG: flagellar motor switch protein FliM [Nitrospirota bacterium]